MLRHQTLHSLHRIAHHPILNLLAGCILLLTGVLEALAMVVEGMFDFPISSSHGVVIFGFLHMIKALPDVLKGVKFVDDGEESLGAYRQPAGSPRMPSGA